MRLGHHLGDCQPEAGALRARREKGFSNLLQQRGADAGAAVAHVDPQIVFALRAGDAFGTNLQCTAMQAWLLARLQRVLDQVEQRTDQRLAVAADGDRACVVAPLTAEAAAQYHFGGDIEFFQQGLHADQLVEHGVAAREDQHVLHLPLHVVQARHQLAAEFLTLLAGELRVVELPGIEHGGGERCADLVGQ